MPKSAVSPYDVFDGNCCRNCYDSYWRGIICDRGIRKSPAQIASATTQPGQVIGSPIHPVEKEEYGIKKGDENQTSSAKSDISSVADELSKLLALKEKGVLSDEEFARLKKDLLDGRR